MDATVQAQIEKVIAFCKSKGVRDVIFRPGAFECYDGDGHNIIVNSSRTPKNQLYILLHEYGHHHILQNRKIGKKFAVLEYRCARNILSEQILAIEEEVLAWHFGEQLAKRFKISLLDKQYQILKAKCLKSHIASYTKITTAQQE